MTDKLYLPQLCRQIRYSIIKSTSVAGSGHPTSSLSAVELMTTLFFNYLDHDRDKVIFSKGHAAPLLYALYHAAGKITEEELMSLRRFDSCLEGHPTPRFKYVDVATGSLGQGLSIGVGMAMGMKMKENRKWLHGNQKIAMENGKEKLDKNYFPISNFHNQSPISRNQFPKVYILLGDSEMAEGQVWEALEIASYYKLNNLIGILDVNRLGQTGETMLGWDVETYKKRVEAFGWRTIIIDDGHDLEKIKKAYNIACHTNLISTEAVDNRSALCSKPTMIIAKTIKGKGVPEVENKNGWHGKVINSKFKI